MKKFYSAIFTLIITIAARAAVWVVAPSGGNYTTIQAAVTAAASGDTIYIKNTAVSSPYQYQSVRFVETANVTITGKSLDIMPYNNDTMFFCQTQWTINPNGLPIVVDIVGMNDSAGAAASNTPAWIQTTGTGPSSSNRATIRILGGQLGTATTSLATCGYISDTASNYVDLTVYGMKIYNNVALTYSHAIDLLHGSIIGDSIVMANDITGTWGGIVYQSESAATPDTAFVQGNIVSVVDAGPTSSGKITYGIIWNSGTEYFDMRNNLVTTQDLGIDIAQTNPSLSATNKLYNCTVNYAPPSGSNSGTSSTYSDTAYKLAPSASSVIEMQNCVAAKNNLNAPATNYNFGINISGSGWVNMLYDYADKNFSPILNGNAKYTLGYNNTQGPITLGTGPITTTYPPASGTTAAATALGYYLSSLSFTGIHGGNPGLSMDNIDNSQNTVGCYGGSFTLSNYFPLNSGAAKTWMVSYPSWVNITAPMNIKATSYDR